MFGGDLLPLPVHARSLVVVHLHAIHSHVALPAFRIAGDHAGQCDKAAAVQRPALKHGKLEYAEIFPHNNLLAGRIFCGHDAGKKSSHFRQHRKHFQFFQQTFRRFEFEQLFDAPGHVIQAIYLKRHLHALFAAELIHQHPAAGIALHILKQQCEAAAGSSTLGNSVGNF